MKKIFVRESWVNTAVTKICYLNLISETHYEYALE